MLEIHPYTTTNYHLTPGGDSWSDHVRSGAEPAGGATLTQSRGWMTRMLSDCEQHQFECGVHEAICERIENPSINKKG